MSRLGLSVGQDSVSRKYTEMVFRQKRLIKQHVKGQIQQSKVLDQIKKTIGQTTSYLKQRKTYNSYILC